MNPLSQLAQLTTVGQWHTMQLILDLPDFLPVLPPDLPADTQVAFIQGEKAFYQFFHDLLQDLYANEREYGVPKEPYVEYYETPQTADAALLERLRAQRLKVRKVIDLGVLEYLYRVGQSGELEGEALKLQCPEYKRILADVQKKARTTTFPQRFETLGLTVTPGDVVVLHNDRYPGMLRCLSSFAKTCAKIKEEGLFYFRRCDFAVFAGKSLPTLEDALHMAPEEVREPLRRTDALLQELKYKREIIVSGTAGAGYRIRYTKKGDKVVYWCRLRTWFYPPLNHNMRWPFESSVTPQLFARLEEKVPGLPASILAQIKKCDHCYGERCGALDHIEYAGALHEVCREAGWEFIGTDPIDFSNLWMVFRQVDDLLEGK